MTPMPLEKALEHLIELMENDRFGLCDDFDRQAAAVLRAFVEKGLPFYRAAQEHFAGERNYATVIDAYRAMKEGK